MKRTHVTIPVLSIIAISLIASILSTPLPPPPPPVTRLVLSSSSVITAGWFFHRWPINEPIRIAQGWTSAIRNLIRPAR